MTNWCWYTLNVYIIKDKCHRETGGPEAFHSDLMFALRIKLINVLRGLFLTSGFYRTGQIHNTRIFFLGLVPLNRTSDSARKAYSCGVFSVITISFFIYNCVGWPGYKSQPMLLLLTIFPLSCSSLIGRQTQFDSSWSGKITSSDEVAHWRECNSRSTGLRTIVISLATQFDPKEDTWRNLTVFTALSAFSG